MNIKKSALAICILSVSIFSMSGCLFLAGAAGGVGVRELTDKSEVYAADKATTEDAVRKTIAALGAKVDETQRKSDAGGDITLRGRTFDDEVLTVDISPNTTKTTEVEIRVGRIGDKDRAKEFHHELQKYLQPASF